jgi:hypothetical protein
MCGPISLVQLQFKWSVCNSVIGVAGSIRADQRESTPNPEYLKARHSAQREPQVQALKLH